MKAYNVLSIKDKHEQKGHAQDEKKTNLQRQKWRGNERKQK